MASVGDFVGPVVVRLLSSFCLIIITAATRGGVVLVGTSASEEDLFGGSAAPLYAAGDFDRQIPTRPHLVLFFAPWCGHCQRLSPVFEKLAEKYNVDLDREEIVIAKVDCTVETALCSENDVIGYPTLLFYWSDPSLSTKYKGKRDISSLEQFIAKMLLDGPPKTSDEIEKSYPVKDSKETLIELTDSSFDAHIAKGYHFVKFFAPWCGHCQLLAPTWEDLAKDFEDDSVTIAKIDCTKFGNICSKHSVRGYPTLLFFSHGQKISEYHGSRNIEALREFVKKTKTEQDELAKLADFEIIPDHKTEGKAVPYELTAEMFDSHIATGHHFVKFYAPWCGHCRELAPTWNELADTLKDVNLITIAKVDCTQFGDLCKQYSIRGYPSLVFFSDGKKIAQYHGSRDIEKLAKFAVQMRNEQEDLKKLISTSSSEEPSGGKDMPSEENKDVVELTDDNFEFHLASGYYFIKFFAPWCGHCKKLAPTWEKLAEAFRDDYSITIAKVDCTKFSDICSKHDVNQYPTLLFFSQGASVAQYQGSRTLEDLKEFAYKVKADQQSKVEIQESEIISDEAKNVNDADSSLVLKLSEESFNTQLENGHNFVSFYEQGCESCDKLSAVWKEMAKKFRNTPEVFMAKVDCTDQPQLCRTNRIERYPTLVLYYKGDLLAEYKGSQDLDSLYAFVLQGLTNPQSLLSSRDEL